MLAGIDGFTERVVRKRRYETLPRAVVIVDTAAAFSGTGVRTCIDDGILKDSVGVAIHDSSIPYGEARVEFTGVRNRA